MVLSKVWASFVLIAVLVGTAFMLFSPLHPNMYNTMVVGKQGDTIRLTQISPTISASDSSLLQAGKTVVIDNQYSLKSTAKGIEAFRLQTADGILATCVSAITICIGLIGILALFMGFLKIAEEAGAIRFLARIIGPFFEKLFPDVPKNNDAFGHMILNFAANILNLDNAATPFGLKAMESLQKINPHKETASNPQIMFLCLHASGLTLIPITIIAFRAKLGAAHPTDVFIPCMIATFAATMAAMTIVAIKQKINLLQPVILGWTLGISVLIGGLILFLQTLSSTQVEIFSSGLSNGLILLIFFCIVIGGLYKKINLFEVFVEGAKGGFETAVRIMPYLVGMMVAISMLRTSGAFDIVVIGFKHIFHFFHWNPQIVDAVPTALMKPFSGSGARGMMIDTMKTFGADSFAGRLSAIFQGSSDTTFYVIAVYYGAVAVRYTKYTVNAMLLADLVGILTAIFVCFLFFG